MGKCIYSWNHSNLQGKELRNKLSSETGWGPDCVQDPYPVTPNCCNSLASLPCTASIVYDPEASILPWWSTRQDPQKILAPKTSHHCGFRGIHPHGPQDKLAATKNMGRGGSRRARQELWQWDRKMQRMEADGGNAGLRGCPQSGIPTHLGSGCQEHGCHLGGTGMLRGWRETSVSWAYALCDLVQIRPQSELLTKFNP